MPRQIPRKGIWFSLANLIASIFPLMPLFPKPPGIKIPEADLSKSDTFLELMVSESNQRIITFALL